MGSASWRGKGCGGEAAREEMGEAARRAPKGATTGSTPGCKGDACRGSSEGGCVGKLGDRWGAFAAVDSPTPFASQPSPWRCNGAASLARRGRGAAVLGGKGGSGGDPTPPAAPCTASWGQIIELASEWSFATGGWVACSGDCADATRGRPGAAAVFSALRAASARSCCADSGSSVASICRVRSSASSASELKLSALDAEVSPPLASLSALTTDSSSADCSPRPAPTGDGCDGELAPLSESEAAGALALLPPALP